MSELQKPTTPPSVQPFVGRPYRFGIAFGILNVLAGVYYGWLTVSGDSIADAISLGASALLAIGTGIGLLRKRRYGLFLMNLAFLMAAIEAIADWFKPHSENLAYYIFANIALGAAAFAILAYFYKRRMEFNSGNRMWDLLSRVRTKDDDVTVMTKKRHFLLFRSPYTTVMPSHLAELGKLGVRFYWNTSDANSLGRLHNLLVQTLQEGLTLPELRYVADFGIKLLSFGSPFIPDDAPLPESLKQTSRYIKRVI